jgi:hypothetical protein
MRFLILAGALLAAMFTAAVGQNEESTTVPTAPEEICPLLIGAEIPDVTLVTAGYESVVLREALATQPTILIYYRGGW